MARRSFRRRGARRTLAPDLPDLSDLPEAPDPPGPPGPPEARTAPHPREPLMPTAYRSIAMLAGALALASLAGLAQPPGAALALPPHDWSYPFCGAQPVITAVYDHEYPTYTCPPNGQAGCVGDNGILRLYNDTVNPNLAYEGHNGWDYATRSATGRNVKQPILAVDDGVVVAAGWHYPGDASAPDCQDQVEDHERGYGLHIRVDHGGQESLYAHLAAIHVAVGDRVARGDVIGASGDTGNSTGPHLHFGAFRPHGTDYYDSFDPYGWNTDWTGRGDDPLPNRWDPWYRESGNASERMLLPGAPDEASCLRTCGPSVVVDDRDPGFALGCQSQACNRWQHQYVGWAGSMWYVRANGGNLDHWASWDPDLPPGTYRVDAFVPAGGNVARAHAVRFRLGSGPSARDAVVDFHEERQLWVSLGVHSFPNKPVVYVLDTVDIPGNWRYAGTCRNVIADAVRFWRMCDPVDPPRVQPG